MTADLHGFSRALREDQEAVLRLLVDGYYALSEREVARQGGDLFRKEGDAIWCAFPSALGAVKAAVAIQEQLLRRRLQRLDPEGMGLRVGIHLGDVVLTEDGEVLGHTLSVAKRLETACAEGAINLSEEVHDQVAGRRLGFDFHDLGEVDLKGVGPHRVFQARITPERLRALEEEQRRGARVAGLRLLVAGLPGALPEGPGRTLWEREALRLAQAAGGHLVTTREDAVLMVLDPGAALEDILSSRELGRARLAVALGDVLVERDGGGGVRGVAGEVVEDALDALRQGWEPGVCLLTEAAARLLQARGDATLEVAGRGGTAREQPLYRLLPEAARSSRISRADDPVVVTGLGRRGPVDMVVGVARGRADRVAGGVEGALAAGLEALGGSWARATPVLGWVAAERIEEEPELALALAVGLMASMERQPPPSGCLAVGRVRADGVVEAPEAELRAGLVEAGPRAPPPDAVLAPPGARALAPAELAVVEVEDLGAAARWLEARGQGTRLQGLARALRQGRLTVVVAGVAGDPEELEELGRALAEDAGLDPDESFPRLAEDAEEEIGREGLEARFRHWARERPPSALARALGELGPELLVSLFPDPRLEPRDGAAREGRFLALGGRLDPPEPLVLTEADFEAMLTRLGDLSADVRRALSGNPLLLVAPAGASRSLQGFLRELRQVAPAGPEARTYLAAGAVAPAEVRRWERRGVEVLDEEPLALVEALRVEALLLGEDPGGAAAAGDGGAAMPERPYKFLDYFGPADRSIFFGRDQEIEEVTRRLLTKPLLVVYGRSGAGKTSLLRAGVLSRLPRPRHLTLTLRVLSDPVELLRAGLRGLAPVPEAAGAEEPGLLELLEQVAGCISGHLVVLLDQFEEFFVRLGAPQRQPFLREVARLARGMPPRVHLIVALREDFLAEMAAFEPYLPSILDNRFRLGLLGEAAAREAIAGPAELFGVRVEEPLLEALCRQLFEEGVDPPQLQIVLDRLWSSRAAGADRLTLEDFERLGGVRRILVGYLQGVLTQDLADEGELAKAVLKAMVTDRGTKAVVEVHELATRTGHGEPAVRAVIDALVRARLVRSLAEEGGHHFELAHEFLIQEVLGWASHEEVALRHARAVLEGERDNWGRYGSLMTPDRLALLERERARLAVDPEERAVLVRAAAVHDRDVLGWLQGAEAQATGVPVLVGMLGERGVDAGCRRRILRTLFGVPLDQGAAQAMVTAMQEVGNPTLLAALREHPDAAACGALLGELEAAVERRFFGPARMASVPAGPAFLGSTPEDKQERLAVLRQDLHERILSERERRSVEVEAFQVDRTLVTNDEFAEFQPVHAHRYAPEEGDHPAVYVSWHDAVAYATWLGKQLPTEEEWEKAARGAEGRRYPWGDAFDPDRVNSAESGLRRTTPVGAYPAGASPYGCLDMAGNVWEWTASSWKEGGPFKVQKGGSTVNFAPHQQPSARFEGFPDFILQWVGFRCVRRGGA